MSDVNDPMSWVEYADNDLAIARAALRRREPFAHISCFHAQQCAEKYLKAMLVAKGQRIPKIHDLIALSEQCTRVDILVAVDVKLLNTLSDHAVRSRYPGDAPTLEDAREALEIAKAVRRFARQYFGLK